MVLKKLNCVILTMVMFLCGKSSASEAPIILESHLPRDIKPLNYDLEIFTPFKIHPTFRGKVCITVKCQKSTDKIILHQIELNIEKNVKINQVPVVTDPPSIIKVQEHKNDPFRNLYTMKLEKSLEKDTNYNIEIEFSGNFSNIYEGLIRFTYGRTPLNVKKQVITFMDKLGARRIFPCFDELGMKATFTIRIGRPSTMQGYSNARFRVTKPASFPQDWFIDEFEKTVLMEASAVAIIVGGLPLASKSFIERPSDPEVRIFADSSFLQSGFINRIAFNIFNFFLNYFDILYAFKKLDLLILPNFQTKAISSYGVIYMSQTTALAASEDLSGFAGYKMVSELCHLMSKQWIGYAVTLSNIRDDYLHTALNLFLQTACVFEISIKINPDWEGMFMEPSIIRSFYGVFQLTDNMKGSFLVMGTDSSWSYDYGLKNLAKAYHLIRMIHSILGQNIFEKSVTNYLRKFEFNNSSANDLWNAFTDTTMEVRPELLSKYNLNIGDIVTKWIDQTGYPLVTILRNDYTKQIIISQRPMYSFDERKQENGLKKCWLIPLNYTTKSKSKSLNMPITFSEWLTCKGPIVMDIDVPQDEWILFDLNVNGRINYDESNWDLIQKSLVSKSDPTVFHGLTRARLTSDMFALAEVGELSYKIVLDAMKYLSLEVHYEIFELALGQFDTIYSRLIGTSIYKSFQKYVREILDPVFNRKEFKNVTEYPSEMNLDFKNEIIASSCQFGVKACIQQSREVIKLWKNGQGKSLAVPKLVHYTIHCQAIKYGNQNHWKFMWHMFKEVDKQNKITILRALGCSNSESVLKRFLDWSINDKMVSKDDSHIIFNSLSSNRKGYNLMKMFFMSRYDEICEFHKSEMYLTLYWVDLFNATVKEEDLRELQNFALSKKVIYMDPSNLSYLSHENAKKNVAWLERSKETFDKYFSPGIFNWRF